MSINTVNSGFRVPENQTAAYNGTSVSHEEKKVAKAEKIDTADNSENDAMAEDPNVSDEIMSEAVAQANNSLRMHHRSIERQVHEVTKAIIYTIRDTETDEVIAEFPPKKIQDMIAKMWELAGLFVDEKA
jgi:flagellar protein FlaG